MIYIVGTPYVKPAITAVSPITALHRVMGDTIDGEHGDGTLSIKVRAARIMVAAFRDIDARLTRLGA